MQPKVILITGVSSGIGEATARALAEAGHRVFGGVRAPEKAPPIPGVRMIRLDVRSEEQVGAAVAQLFAEAGRIDVLVNNAGVSLVGPIEATSLSEARDLFETNVFGMMSMVKAVLPTMRHQRAGLIVNMSSVLGFLPAPFMGLYASSKHALEGLSETLDHEVREFGIRTILIQPSFTRTKLDTSAHRTDAQIGAYAKALASSADAVGRQVAEAPLPQAVAAEILRAIEGVHRLRRPADGRAILLSFLRRFAPAKQVDRNLRAAFGL